MRLLLVCREFRVCIMAASGGAEGKKEEGDPKLRLSYEEPQWNELSDWIKALAEAKKASKALQYGTFASTVLTNGQCVFLREWEGQRVYVAVNAAGDNFLQDLMQDAVRRRT